MNIFILDDKDGRFGESLIHALSGNENINVHWFKHPYDVEVALSREKYFIGFINIDTDYLFGLDFFFKLKERYKNLILLVIDTNEPPKYDYRKHGLTMVKRPTI